MARHHDPQQSAAPTITGWAELVPAGATVLDVAAGGGRHARLFAERGHVVTAIDRDTTALREAAMAGVEVIEADLEHAPWPLAGRTFGAVVVVNYLWRPLVPVLIASVQPGGLLLYETFAVGNERFGRPSNPDFLLREGELLEAVRGECTVLDYGHGAVGSPPTAMRQRMLARRVVRTTAGPD